MESPSKNLGENGSSTDGSLSTAKKMLRGSFRLTLEQVEKLKELLATSRKPFEPSILFAFVHKTMFEAGKSIPEPTDYEVYIMEIPRGLADDLISVLDGTGRVAKVRKKKDDLVNET